MPKIFISYHITGHVFADGLHDSLERDLVEVNQHDPRPFSGKLSCGRLTDPSSPSSN